MLNSHKELIAILCLWVVVLLYFLFNGAANEPRQPPPIKLPNTSSFPPKAWSEPPVSNSALELPVRHVEVVQSPASTTATPSQAATTVQPAVVTVAPTTSISPQKNDCPNLIRAKKKESARAENTATIVAMFYQIPNKHGQAKYDSWMQHFFLKLLSPMHVFTNCHTLKKAQSFSKFLGEREKQLAGRLFVDTLELDDTLMAKELGSVLHKQEKNDPEKHLGHNYYLYIVWLMKAELLNKAAKANIFATEWYIYSDAGCFRHPHSFREWPSPSRLALLDKKRFLFELISGFGNAPKTADIDSCLKKGRAGCHLIYQDHIAGGYIGVNAVQKTDELLLAKVLETAKFLSSNGHLIVKDQVTYNSLFLRHPELFTLVPAQGPGDPWFYMNYFLANSKERGTAALSTPIVRN